MLCGALKYICVPCFGFELFGFFELLDLKNNMLFILFFCSVFDGNSKHFIHDLEGRSGEENTRNGSVAEQVAGSFCYAGLGRGFGTVPKSECPQIVSVVP